MHSKKDRVNVKPEGLGLWSRTCSPSLQNGSLPSTLTWGHVTGVFCLGARRVPTIHEQCFALPCTPQPIEVKHTPIKLYHIIAK